jgi:hypothetical protein
VFLEVYPQVLGVSTHKRCNKCGELKPLDAFNKNSSESDGFNNRCRDCVHISSKQYRERHRDEINEKKRRHRAEHAPEARAYAKQYRADHVETIRERKRRYSAANAEKERARARLWAAEHPEAIQERSRRNYAERSEEKRDYQRQWHANNPDKVKVHRLTRRAKKANSAGVCTLNDLASIRAAQTDKKGRLICWRCGKPINGTPDLDHWIPLDKSGAHSAGNLHYMHARCNRSKGAKHPTEIGRLI